MPETHTGDLHTSWPIRRQQHSLVLCTPQKQSRISSTRRCSAHLQDDQVSAARTGALHTSKLVTATPHGVGSLLHCRKPSATMWRDNGLLVKTASTLRNTMDSRHSATRVEFLVRSSPGPFIPLTHLAQHKSTHWRHAHHAQKVTHCCRGDIPAEQRYRGTSFN